MRLSHYCGRLCCAGELLVSAAMQFRVEMSEGQQHRVVDADHMVTEGDWLIFYRKPPEGGRVEHWRAALRFVVCVESKARGKS